MPRKFRLLAVVTHQQLSCVHAHCCPSLHSTSGQQFHNCSFSFCQPQDHREKPSRAHISANKVLPPGLLLCMSNTQARFPTSGSLKLLSKRLARVQMDVLCPETYIPPPDRIKPLQEVSSPLGTVKPRKHMGKQESTPTHDGQRHLWPLPSQVLHRYQLSLGHLLWTSPVLL